MRKFRRVALAAAVAAGVAFYLPAPADAATALWAGVCTSAPSAVTFSPALGLIAPLGVTTLNPSAFSCTLTAGSGVLTLSGPMTGALGCAAGAAVATLHVHVDGSVGYDGTVTADVTNSGGLVTVSGANIDLGIVAELIPDQPGCSATWRGVVVIEDPTVDSGS